MNRILSLTLSCLCLQVTVFSVESFALTLILVPLEVLFSFSGCLTHSVHLWYIMMFLGWAFSLNIYFICHAQDFLGFLNLNVYTSWVLRKSEPFITLNTVSHSLFSLCTPFKWILELFLLSLETANLTNIFFLFSSV